MEILNSLRILVGRLYGGENSLTLVIVEYGGDIVIILTVILKSCSTNYFIKESNCSKKSAFLPWILNSVYPVV